jgi:hypothetical protein
MAVDGICSLFPLNITMIFHKPIFFTMLSMFRINMLLKSLACLYFLLLTKYS